MPLINDKLAFKTNTQIALYRPILVNDDLIGQRRPGYPYITRCIDHGELAHFKTRYEADRGQARPDKWCQGCQRKAWAAAKPKVGPRKDPVRKDPRGRPRKFSYHA